MNPILAAALWMTGAIASFSAMAVAGREVSFALDTFEIMTWRSLIGVIIVTILVHCTGNWHRITTVDLRSHTIRNLAHFTGQNLWFHAITLIPLAHVFALEFTSPIWVLILSPLLLGEGLTRIRILAAIMGFVGILIITRPSLETLNPGVAMAALSAIGFALSAIYTKRLTRQVTTLCIMFWLTVMQLVMGLICAGFDGDIALPDATTAPWLVLIGLAGLVAHTCLTKALSLAPATVTIPIDFTRLPVIAVIGMLFYDEALDIWVFIGAAVIFAGNYANILAEARRAKAA